MLLVKIILNSSFPSVIFFFIIICIDLLILQPITSLYILLIEK